MENLQMLSREELDDVGGGGWLQELAFVAGYQAGKTIDLLHGFYDGITGMAKH
jgi:hypothetical protein